MGVATKRVFVDNIHKDFDEKIKRKKTVQWSSRLLS